MPPRKRKRSNKSTSPSRSRSRSNTSEKREGKMRKRALRRRLTKSSQSRKTNQSSRNRSRSLSKTGTSSPNSDEPYYEIGDQTDSYSESELIVITVDGQDYKNETFDSGSKSQDSSDANSETLSDVSSGDEAQPPKRRKKQSTSTDKDEQMKTDTQSEENALMRKSSKDHFNLEKSHIQQWFLPNQRSNFSEMENFDAPFGENRKKKRKRRKKKKKNPSTSASSTSGSPSGSRSDGLENKSSVERLLERTLDRQTELGKKLETMNKCLSDVFTAGKVREIVMSVCEKVYPRRVMDPDQIRQFNSEGYPILCSVHGCHFYDSGQQSMIGHYIMVHKYNEDSAISVAHADETVRDNSIERFRNMGMKSFKLSCKMCKTKKFTQRGMMLHYQQQHNTNAKVANRMSNKSERRLFARVARDYHSACGEYFVFCLEKHCGFAAILPSHMRQHLIYAHGKKTSRTVLAESVSLRHHSLRPADQPNYELHSF